MKSVVLQIISEAGLKLTAELACKVSMILEDASLKAYGVEHWCLRKAHEIENRSLTTGLSPEDEATIDAAIDRLAREKRSGVSDFAAEERVKDVGPHGIPAT